MFTTNLRSAFTQKSLCALCAAVFLTCLGASAATAEGWRSNDTSAPVVRGAPDKSGFQSDYTTGNSADFGPAARRQVVQHYGPNVYKPTPIGPVSIPYGEDRYGPHHLKQMSKTERLPAPAQPQGAVPGQFKRTAPTYDPNY